MAASTVSVVLNEVNGARVSDPTRQRVHEAAQLLGYTGNDYARHLRRGGRPTRSGVLVNDLIATGPYGAALIEGAQAAAWRAGAQLVVLNTGGIPQREAEALSAAPTRHAHAVILASLSFGARPVPDVRGLVLANVRPARDGRIVPHAVADESGGGAQVASELRSLGHEQIGIVTIAGAESASARLRGFRKFLRGSGIAAASPSVARVSRFAATAEGGYLAAERLLRARPGLTALWCFNDRMAMGAYRAAAERGHDIPGSLSIIGFDNLEPVAESLWPPLTTIALPYFEIGERALEIALDPDHPVRRRRSQRVELPCTLVRRFSAGPVGVRSANSPADSGPAAATDLTAASRKA